LTLGQAQNLKIEWERTFDDLANCHINSLSTTSEQGLVAVGYSINSKKSSEDTEGVLLMLDPATGVLTTTPKFLSKGKSTYNELIAAAETTTGDWLLVGNAGEKHNRKTAWISRLNRAGQEETINLSLNDRSVILERISSLADGSLLIQGSQNTIGLTLWKYKKVVTSLTIPPLWQNLNKVLAFDALDTKNLVLAGESVGDDLAWWAVQKEDVATPVKKFSAPDFFPDLATAFFDADTKPIFWGTVQPEDQSNIWLGITEGISDFKQTSPLIEKRFGDKRVNLTFSAALPLSNDFFLVALSYEKSNTVLNKLWRIGIHHEPHEFEPILENLGDARYFKIKGLTMGLDSSIFVFGQVEQERKPSIFKLIKLKFTESKSKNGLASAAVDCSPVRFDDSEQGGDGNGVLNVNETGSAFFNVKATSPLQYISVEATVTGRGVRIVGSAVRTFSFKNGQTSVRFPIQSTAELVGNSVKIRFLIKLNGQTIKEWSGEIPCNAPLSSRGGLTMDYDLKEKTARTNNNDFTVRGKTFVPPNSDPKMRFDNNPKEDFQFEKIRTANDGREVFEFSKTIRLTEGENVIPIQIDYGTEVFYDTLRIFCKPRNPNLYVVAIAPETDLKHNRKDAEDFIKAIEKQRGMGYYNAIYTELYADFKSTTTAKIKGIFERLAAKANATDDENRISQKDVLILFISSHGRMVQNRFKIVPSDIDVFNDTTILKSTVDYRADILEQLQKFAGKKIVLIDACHSGGAKSKSKTQEADDPAVSAALNTLISAASGISTIASCQSQEVSYESDTLENGTFTEGVLEALAGLPIDLKQGVPLTADSNKDGLLSIGELYAFLQKRVPNLTQHYIGKSQTPFMPTQELAADLVIFKF
jgi:hypothetical protein